MLYEDVRLSQERFLTKGQEAEGKEEEMVSVGVGVGVRTLWRPKSWRPRGRISD